MTDVINFDFRTISEDISESTLNKLYDHLNTTDQIIELDTMNYDSSTDEYIMNCTIIKTSSLSSDCIKFINSIKL